MAGKAMVLPTCHDPHECFGKIGGNLCRVLRDTYPRGTPCPFRKTYEENILVNGTELTPDEVAERKAERERQKEENHEADFWEAFHYCSES